MFCCLYHGGVRLRYWLPPVVWMVVIMGFSSDMGSAKHTGHWLFPIFTTFVPEATAAQLEAMHALVRKVAHVAEYAVLATLWFRTFTRGLAWSARGAGWIALGIALGWALLDEAFQSMRPSRTGSRVDVAIDMAGALFAVAVARSGWRRAVDWTTTTLLWVGLVGGALFLAVNVLAGVPSGALWLTVPAAALLLLLRRRLHSRRPAASTEPPPNPRALTPGTHPRRE
jgi:VanZ family protein